MMSHKKLYCLFDASVIVAYYCTLFTKSQKVTQTGIHIPIEDELTAASIIHSESNFRMTFIMRNSFIIMN